MNKKRSSRWLVATQIGGLMRSSIAYLVSNEYAQNSYGVMERTESKRKVFVDVASVTSQEFFEGGRNGLRPAYRFTMFQFDYLGEQVIEYKGEQYTIYRTYVRSYDTIELYTEFKKGNEQKA